MCEFLSIDPNTKESLKWSVSGTCTVCKKKQSSNDQQILVMLVVGLVFHANGLKSAQTSKQPQISVKHMQQKQQPTTQIRKIDQHGAKQTRTTKMTIKPRQNSLVVGRSSQDWPSKLDY